MGKLNMNKMREIAKQEAERSSFSGGFDKLEDGKNVRRILFPKGDYDDFATSGMVHYGLGEDGKTMVTCPKTFDERNKCPICEYVETLQKSSRKSDSKLAESLKAKRRIYVNVLNRDDDEDDEVPKVLSIGQMIYKAVVDAIIDPDYGDVTDYSEGRDVTITKSGKGLNTKYSVLFKPKSTVASEDYTKEELDEKMADLKALFVEKSYEELECLLNGEEYQEDKEDDDSDDIDYDELSAGELKELCEDRGIEIPEKANRLKLISLLAKYDESGSTSKKTSKAKASEEDDDFDEDEDEDIDDVKPYKGRVIKGEDDEDEEEVKPRSKGKSKSDVKNLIEDALKSRKSK